jgi:hypothetical protein
MGNWPARVLGGIAKNMPNLLLHTAAMTLGPPLQPSFNVLLDTSDNELSHGETSIEIS